MMWTMFFDPGGIALFDANDDDMPGLRQQMSLESLQDSKIFGAINSGGVASLSHRLMAVMPPA